MLTSRPGKWLVFTHSRNTCPNDLCASIISKPIMPYFPRFLQMTSTLSKSERSKVRRRGGGPMGRGEAAAEGGRITRGFVQLTPNRTLHRDGTIVKASCARKSVSRYTKQVHVYVRMARTCMRDTYTHTCTRAHQHIYERMGAAAALRYISQEGGVTSYVLNTSPEVLWT